MSLVLGGVAGVHLYQGKKSHLVCHSVALSPCHHGMRFQVPPQFLVLAMRAAVRLRPDGCCVLPGDNNSPPEVLRK